MVISEFDISLYQIKTGKNAFTEKQFVTASKFIGKDFTSTSAWKIIASSQSFHPFHEQYRVKWYLKPENMSSELEHINSL